jgi:hypothetical protein
MDNTQSRTLPCSGRRHPLKLLIFNILKLIFHTEQFISYCLGDYKVIKEGLGVDAIKGVFMKTAGFVVYGQNTCVTYNFRCEEVDRYL